MRNDNLVHHAISGEEYVRQITRLEEDRLARASFQRLVLDLSPPGARIFDFGAGPGIDARFFAERGYAVRAYDASPRMLEYFVVHCREYLETGRIVLESGDYREFLARAARTAASDGNAASAADLIISNFAPLSLVGDLEELFAALHALTRPGGRILASVLNAYYLPEMIHPWWLRRWPRLMRDGAYTLPSPEGPLTRRRLREFQACASPYFRLARAYPGVSRSAPRGMDPARLDPASFLRLIRARFTFLLFERVDRGATSASRPGTQ
jgi:SAM-dependent methyltransferase